MKKLISAMALVVALLSTACSGGGNTAPAPREAAAPTTDTAYCGTYQGTLPAADCPGIKTVLTIAADSTYTLSSQYIDRQAQPVVTSGVYHLKQGGDLLQNQGCQVDCHDRLGRHRAAGPHGQVLRAQAVT